MADFLFTKNQMSGGDIDTLMSLWKAAMVKHGDDAPFKSHEDLYKTIDATPLGDVPWESFSLSYQGARPPDNVPSWMESGYDVWFRDPRTVVRNLLANPDFNNEFDYAPYQEYDANNEHRYRDFMSGNWSWKQAVNFSRVFNTSF
jgi:hypothetical protein